MTPNERIMLDMAALYQNFKIAKSGLAGVLNVLDQMEVYVEPDILPRDWQVIDFPSGANKKLADVKGAPRLIISQFINDFGDLFLRAKDEDGEQEDMGGDIPCDPEPEIEPEIKPEQIPVICPDKVSEPVEDKDPDPIDNLRKSGFTVDDFVEEAKVIPEPEIVHEPVKVSEPVKQGNKVAQVTGNKPAPKNSKKAVTATVPNNTVSLAMPLDIRAIQIEELTIEDIRKYVNIHATTQEAGMFVRLCQARGLNPFLSEAHLIKYSPTEKATFVTGKECYTRRAELNKHVKGWKAGIIVRLKATDELRSGPVERREGAFKLPEEELLGGWAEATRDDKDYVFKYEVTLSEFIGKKKDGSTSKMWLEKPCTMIRKDAIVGVLREACPAEFSGLYDAVEMSGEVIDAVYSVE